MASVTGLFNKLKVQQDNEEHLQVYETSSKILETAFDLSVMRTCLVALINLDSYNLALNILNKYPTDKTDLIQEKAYIYYKLNKSKLLAEILDQESLDDRGLLHLKAQFYYQQGDNVEALKLYRKLIETSPEDEVFDLSVNERAVFAQSLMMNDEQACELLPISTGDSSSYDLLFNNSLIELNKGNFNGSLTLLKRARELCEEAVSQYKEDEKIAELFPILLQTSQVYFKIGDIELSEALLQQLLEKINSYENDDKMAKLLILNNLYAIKLIDTDINSNLIYSNLKFPNILSQLNFTKPQLLKLESNERVLSLSSGKASIKLFELISEIDFKLDDKIVAKKLFRLAMRNKDLSLNLLALQYNNQISNYDASYLLINNLIDEKLLLSTPSLILIQTFIYGKLNKDIAKLLTNISKSIDSYDLTTRSNYKVFEELTFQLLSVKQDDIAMDIAHKLLKINPNDRLLSALIKSDVSQLTPVSELTAGIDADELIANGLEDETAARGVKRFKSNRVTKAKYKRHKKIPEHLVGRTAEPERWLPLKDRSTYKPKKGKKLTATQGGNADNSTEMNIVSTPSLASNTTSSKNKNQKKKGKKRH